VHESTQQQNSSHDSFLPCHNYACFFHQKKIFFLALDGGYLQVQQSCIQGYSQAEDAMAFQAAGSVVISEYNWVDWYSTTIGQCPYAPDGLFVEDEEGSACFTGGVEGCNGNCTSGFPGTEATECVVGTTGQPLEYDVNTFYNP